MERQNRLSTLTVTLTLYPAVGRTSLSRNATGIAQSCLPARPTRRTVPTRYRVSPGRDNESPQIYQRIKQRLASFGTLFAGKPNLKKFL